MSRIKQRLAFFGSFNPLHFHKALYAPFFCPLDAVKTPPLVAKMPHLMKIMCYKSKIYRLE